jgi:hypothetical protein
MRTEQIRSIRCIRLIRVEYLLRSPPERPFSQQQEPPERPFL